jgi:hypothetical protein
MRVEVDELGEVTYDNHKQFVYLTAVFLEVRFLPHSSEAGPKRVPVAVTLNEDLMESTILNSFSFSRRLFASILLCLEYVPYHLALVELH